ncbi:hypothetical protein Tter_0954 [Thermobaculum terrenum ATCC BAA-798]|uniref:Uncharacterized protein n=1 Tax=Thermobaculum terrenum (strain ATCC BAA-798 / CCMEE 7001 / YNP1) TaxID=525904 RepID=D1CG15_THET1|nr:hypothetical protein [Thermobaculum terrenum]ACZ41871.1 hypothetical protein Tter_0954 [Thermobaculum terrenum ATCC BAA-798]
MEETVDLRIEEEDISTLIQRLAESGNPQNIDTLTDWYIQIVIERLRRSE